MMSDQPDIPVTIRPYDVADHGAVVVLFTRINRELAPPDMRERFEEYIAATINGELSNLGETFSEARRNAFWVVAIDVLIVGMFGIESGGGDSSGSALLFWCRHSIPRPVLAISPHCINGTNRTRLLVPSNSFAIASQSLSTTVHSAHLVG
jgi:hypothetical protein